MRENTASLARLNPLWIPWSVPRVAKRSAAASAIVRASRLDKWIARKHPSPFQRCLAIHILNATHSEDAV